ncbi:hypothetical protein ACH5RR_002060 [Cinchona calisaya]|uniref:ABC-2 type transporter transmembrane domain-containing protein n=1 Tax=Cinchona calisaya TaxID=153742 RepID=A0ABD3B578_9GENT
MGWSGRVNERGDGLNQWGAKDKGGFDRECVMGIIGVWNCWGRGMVGCCEHEIGLMGSGVKCESEKAYVTHDNILTWTLTSCILLSSAPITKYNVQSRDDYKGDGLENCIDTRIGGFGINSKGLSNGQQRRFFYRNGFSCPDLQNPADHYLRIINTDFNEDIEPGGVEGNIIATIDTIDILVKSYASSDTNNLILREVERIKQQRLEIVKKQNSRASFIVQCLILTERSFMNMYRDPSYYRLRLPIYIGLGFCLGFVFYNVGNSYSSINARGSMLIFVASLLTFMSIGGLPSFMEEMKVFKRERLNGHYGVAAFVISNTVSSIRFLFLIAVIPAVIAYYLVGLHPGTERFLYFTLVILASIMLVEGLMMIVASLVPNFFMGLIIGAGILGLL